METENSLKKSAYYIRVFKRMHSTQLTDLPFSSKKFFRRNKDEDLPESCAKKFCMCIVWQQFGIDLSQ